MATRIERWIERWIETRIKKGMLRAFE